MKDSVVSFRLVPSSNCFPAHQTESGRREVIDSFTSEQRELRRVIMVIASSTMPYEPSKSDASHDKDIGAETATSGYHFTVQSNAGSNVPPINDPLAVRVVKISGFRQVYSSKKLVWLF